MLIEVDFMENNNFKIGNKTNSCQEYKIEEKPQIHEMTQKLFMECPDHARFGATGESTGLTANHFSFSAL